MANKNYSYPRVTMSTVAKKHSHNRVNVPDTTVMFAPLVTEKGPDDRLIKVHSLNEFISTFGSMDRNFYEWNGQMALNVYNWLNNGGTLYVKRLIVNSENKAKYDKTDENGAFVSLKIDILESLKNQTVFDGEKLNDKELLSALVSRDSIKVLNNLNTVSMDSNFVVDFGSLSGVEYGRNVTDVNGTPFYFYLANETEDADGNRNYNLVMTTEEIQNFRTINTTKNGVTGNFQLINQKYTFANAGSPISLDNSDVKKYATDNEMMIVSENGNYIIKEFKSSHSSECTACITVATVKATKIEFSIEAKYHGEYYKDLIFIVEPTTTTGYFNFKIYKGNVSGRPLEQFLSLKKDNCLAALNSSDYISIKHGENFVSYLSSISPATSVNDNKQELHLEGSADTMGYSQTITLLEEFWDGDVKNFLASRLESPIDIIFDAGYPVTIKEKILEFAGNMSDNPTRPDIIVILDNYILNTKLRLNEPNDIGMSTFIESIPKDTTNIALYEQYFTVNEPSFAGQDIYVTPTYFLSKLFIYNDLTYGMQYPTAGLRRALLDDVLYVNQNPDADTKEDWFKKRINYAERTSRETAFMSQRVMDGSDDYEYTALSFLNNVRVLEKMKKELESIGRSYLHEFNDAITIANMSAALNKYVATWISNRTLSLGVVTVEQNEVSENALDINLTIRFTNTIEVINVSIVIE